MKLLTAPAHKLGSTTLPYWRLTTIIYVFNMFNNKIKPSIYFSL
jgi:hypothetical protein